MRSIDAPTDGERNAGLISHAIGWAAFSICACITLGAFSIVMAIRELVHP